MKLKICFFEIIMLNNLRMAVKWGEGEGGVGRLVRFMLSRFMLAYRQVTLFSVTIIDRWHFRYDTIGFIETVEI